MARLGEEVAASCGKICYRLVAQYVAWDQIVAVCNVLRHCNFLSASSVAACVRRGVG